MDTYDGAEQLSVAQLEAATRGHKTDGAFGGERCECSGCALKRDRKRLGFCSDCGAVGERRGHMACQYPQEAR